MQDTAFGEYISVFQIWDRAIRGLFAAEGGKPYDTTYKFQTDAELRSIMPYVAMPLGLPNWAAGKQYELDNSGLPYEVIINTDPSLCYMRESNTIALDSLIIAHAACGHSHFFRNNRYFAKSGAKTILERLAGYEARIEALRNDPNFGIERVEYTMDAANAIAFYCFERGEFDNGLKSTSALRSRLEQKLTDLQLKRENMSGFEAEGIDKLIAELRERVNRDPIRKTRNILAFLLDEKHNPGLSEEERFIIAAVLDVSRYFWPQMETKFMNEGFASWCHNRYIKLMGMHFPANWSVELLGMWTMFDKDPMARYFNYYALTQFLLDDITRELCPMVEGEFIEADLPDFKAYPESKLPKGLVLPKDKTLLARTINNEIMVFSGKTKKVQIPRQDVSKIFEIVREYRDTSFFREFLTHDRLKRLHDRSLSYIIREIKSINHTLRLHGWGPETLVRPIPGTLAGIMEAVQKWLGLAQASQQMHESMGSPIFPVHIERIYALGQLVQLIASYDHNKEKFRQGMLLRLASRHRSMPDVAIIDGGNKSEKRGTLVLEHQFDPVTGFLKQSEARKVLPLMMRLWRGGDKIELRTKEGDVNEHGEIEGDVRDHSYTVDRSGKVTG